MIVDLAHRHRPARDPDMQEASMKLAACTVRMYRYDPGSVLFLAAQANRDWWLREVQRLNPGGAEIIPFPERRARR